MNTKVSGLIVNLRVASNVVRLVSPGVADCVSIFAMRCCEGRGEVWREILNSRASQVISD